MVEHEWFFALLVCWVVDINIAKMEGDLVAAAWFPSPHPLGEGLTQSLFAYVRLRVGSGVKIECHVCWGIVAGVHSSMVLLPFCHPTLLLVTTVFPTNFSGRTQLGGGLRSIHFSHSGGGSDWAHGGGWGLCKNASWSCHFTHRLFNWKTSSFSAIRGLYIRPSTFSKHSNSETLADEFGSIHLCIEISEVAKSRSDVCWRFVKKQSNSWLSTPRGNDVYSVYVSCWYLKTQCGKIVFMDVILRTQL